MDTFLRALPSLPQNPASSSGVKGKDLSLAHSSHLHKSLCSVHLARLYEVQKKHKKAIEMYRRLMDREPAKEAYFASKIQNLKN